LTQTAYNFKQLAKTEYSGTISPDGHYTVYQKSATANDLGLWRMDVGDGREEQMTEGNVGIWATFSPDGKWIVFTRYAERVGLWKVPLEGGEPTRILDENAICPAISPDGKTVAFVWRQGGKPNRIALVSFDGGEITKVFDLKLETNPIGDQQNLQWTNDGHGFYLTALNDGVSNIWRQPIDGGQPEQVTNFTTGRIFNFAFSPDGLQLALSRGTFNTDVVLIENAK
jgi:Tol biopolymer transport system component